MTSSFSAEKNYFYLLYSLHFCSLGTPICLDLFGWTESETVLYLGIAMSGGGTLMMIGFLLVGKMSRRFVLSEFLFFRVNIFSQAIIVPDGMRGY